MRQLRQRSVSPASPRRDARFSAIELDEIDNGRRGFDIRPEVIGVATR